MNKQTLIDRLRLAPHREGGYFTRTYTASRSHLGRHYMTSIYYLLTDDSPTGHLHRNRSDIVHYWQLGSAIRYTLLSPEGRLLNMVLGPDLDRGHQLQLTVPGGFWKASQLAEGEFGLVSEAVCPGFDFDDHDMAVAENMAKHYPEHWPTLAPLCQENSTQ